MSARLLNLKQAADLLGYSESWLYHEWPRLKAEYNLNIIRIGKGKLKFPEKEINKIIKANIIQ